MCLHKCTKKNRPEQSSLWSQDPTNGYYNVRATTHEEARPQSHAIHYQGEFRPPNPNTGPAGATSSGPSASPGGAVPPSAVPGSRTGCYDPRPPSRMSHATYAQFNTFSRVAQSQQAPPNPALRSPGDYPGDCGLLDSTTQLAYDNYGYPTQYPSYRMGFAPPIEEGPAYEMYPTGQGTGPGPGPGQQSPETGLGKYGSSTRFSYSSPPSDYSHRHTQRMQTHVWETHLHAFWLNFAATVLITHKEESSLKLKKKNPILYT